FELTLRSNRLAVRRRDALAVGVEQFQPKAVLLVRLVPRDLEQRGDEEPERPLRVHHRPAAADHIELSARDAREIRQEQRHLHGTKATLKPMSRGAYVLDLGRVPYREAWDLQRSLAGAVSQGAIPDTVVFLEHPPVVTLGRRTEDGELHVPAATEVEVVETDRGGKST